MKLQPTNPTFSLRAKLVLSYLAVALAAIIALAIVVSFAVQNYFEYTQRVALQSQANYEAEYIESLYNSFGGWANFPNLQLRPNDLILLMIETSDGRIICPQSSITHDYCNDAGLKQSLNLALQGQDVFGNLQATVSNNTTFNGQYIAVPLHLDDQANDNANAFGSGNSNNNGNGSGQIIGSMLWAAADGLSAGLFAQRLPRQRQ